VGDVDLSNPKAISCEVGHSFCDVCNQKDHGSLSCSSAKSYLSIHDDPKTICCPY